MLPTTNLRLDPPTTPSTTDQGTGMVLSEEIIGDWSITSYTIPAARPTRSESSQSPPPSELSRAPIPIIPTVTIEEVSTTYNQEPAAPAPAPGPAPAPANEEPPVLRYSIYRQQNALLVT